VIRASAAGPKKSPIKWHDDFYAAHELAVEADKPLLIVFGATWCANCTKLEQTTLAHPKLGEYVNAGFVPVHLDYDQNERLAEILEVKFLPCTIILSPEADLLGRKIGYAEIGEYYRVLEKGRQSQLHIRQAAFEQPAGE
jgi:thiol-disulfide isomerase/thioredoxin